MKLTEEELNLFELAFLLRTPLYVLLDNMSHEEYLGWSAYFKERPYGWREDRRTSLTMQAFGAKVDTAALFPTLATKTKESIGNSLMKSGWMTSLLNAKGGDNLKEIFPDANEVEGPDG